MRSARPSGVDIAGGHQQAGELLAAVDDAGFGALLDRIDGITAGIGQAAMILALEACACSRNGEKSLVLSGLRRTSNVRCADLDDDILCP